MHRPHDHLRVVVAGSGGITRRQHLRALGRLPDVRVVAVADSSARACAAIERSDVDAVVVCGSSTAHAELALAALDRGRHLYLEQPLSTGTADGRRIDAAARRAGTVTAIGLAYRFDPLYGRARALLGEGVIGRLREVSTTYHEPGSPARGGALIELGVHHLDLLTWLTGESLRAFDDSELSHRHARLHAELSGGAQVEATFGYGGVRRCGWVFAGDDGWLAIDRCMRRLTLARGSIHLPGARRGDAVRTLIRSLPGTRRERVHDRALSAWAGHAAGRRGADLPTPRDWLRVLEAVRSAEEAAATAPPRSAAPRG